jgi:hypothetical protein
MLAVAPPAVASTAGAGLLLQPASAKEKKVAARRAAVLDVFMMLRYKK